MTSDCSRPVDEIARQAAMYRFMIENSADIIIRYDAARQRVYVSPASRQMLGYEPEEMMSRIGVEIIHPEDLPRVHPGFLAHGRENPDLKAEFRVRRKDGEYIWVEARHRYVPADGTSVGVMRDITARKNAEIMLSEVNEKLAAANEVLRRLADLDGLTGLANRRRFDELLAQEFTRAARQQEPLAVLLLDVDCFKAYNDRYGHLAGDECLRLISRTIEAGLRRPGDHAARYGGEEFVALLPATGLTGALVLADGLCQAVSALRIEHAGGIFGLATISIGASAVIPGHDDIPAHLVEAADRALYRAKADGRNRVRGSEPPSQPQRPANALVAQGNCSL